MDAKNWNPGIQAMFPLPIYLDKASGEEFKDLDSELKNLIEKTNSKALIEVDGGVNKENAKQLFDYGANVLVAGSSVFKSDDPISTISYLNSL